MSEKIADELHAFIAAAPHKYPGHLIELFDRAEKALRRCSAGSGEEWNPTDEQVRSAAMWYRHDLGLLTVAEAAKVKTEARLWLRSWQKEVAALRAEPQAASMASDDPTASKEWNDGCDFAMTQLCKFLDVEPSSVSWDAATETVEGDVSAVIGNILRAKFGEDWGPQCQAVCAPHTASGERLYTLKEATTALEQAVQALALTRPQCEGK